MSKQGILIFPNNPIFQATCQSYGDSREGLLLDSFWMLYKEILKTVVANTIDPNPCLENSLGFQLFLHLIFN